MPQATRHFSRVFSILMLMALVGVIALLQVGCNTTKGAGKDLEKAGEAIQDAAE